MKEVFIDPAGCGATAWLSGDESFFVVTLVYVVQTQHYAMPFIRFVFLSR